ncbi:DUF4097 family beta strand repeat-containing protein [Heyndrickxia acidicola]|uniref:DUF4097 domain-containing protein n=1 Tax=Heyndrickxia acidicola TaxID=209389 RepID=A0ABU6MJB9_9BACI|nr:DUF4097 domain-containing protein [Heyndrickxia acidicola]MED1203758.1 DUF4097 domain-containing protein [Heyndrickxia acidicola]
MQAERKRILDLLKDGKLSTEEALTLLEALDKEAGEKGNPAPESRASYKEKEETFEEKQQEEEEFSTREEKYARSGKSSFDEKQFAQFAGAKDKILDLVSTAIKKVKDFDLQLNQSVEFPHVFQQSNAIVNRVDIDVANGHVEVKPWDQQDVRIECQVKVFRTDDREEARSTFIKNSYYAIENEKLRFTTQSKWIKTDTVVYLPRQTYEKASIRTFNGRISADGIHAEDMKVKTANGKIQLSDVESEKMEAETANGKITIINSKASRLAAETMNGSLDVEGKFVSTDLQTFNGNINCTLGEEMMDTIHTKAVTGSISIYLPADISVEGECKSNLGNYKIDLEGYEVLDEKKEIVQKQLRFNRSGHTEVPVHLFADTKTGSIYIK